MCKVQEFNTTKKGKIQNNRDFFSNQKIFSGNRQAINKQCNSNDT